MLEETRLHRITALLSTLNQVSTEVIIQHLGVSRETVRRDVLKLEDQGKLRRVHGGVISCQPEAEKPLEIRSLIKKSEKKSIARETVKQLKAGQAIFIDAGSTTSYLAEELLSMSGLTVVTNSLEIANCLSSVPEQHEVILLGGHMGKTTQATSGEITLNELNRYRADIAILSPVGLSHEAGASSFYHHEAAIASSMVKQAKSTIILADSDKIGVTSRTVYATPFEINMLITDSKSAGHPEISKLNSSIAKIIFSK
ncbi:DeoR/GlpR family DNA-binding transcription regulator [Vibrio sp. RC27]